MVAHIKKFPLKTLSICVLMSCSSAWAADYFDPELLALGTGTTDVDLSAFANPVAWRKVITWLISLLTSAWRCPAR